jgi:hypothetical protein
MADVAREGSDVDAGVGDEHVETMIAVEVGEDGLSRVLRARNGSVEQLGGGVAQVAVTVAREDRQWIRLDRRPTNVRDDEIVEPVAGQITGGELRHRQRNVRGPFPFR